MAIPRLYRLLPVLLALALVCGCDKGDKATPTDQAKDDKNDKDDEGDESEESAKQDEDKGHAKLKLGERDWSTERASAQLQDTGHLRVRASRTEKVDGESRREALTLLIRDYKGPGSYTTDKVNSNFTGVGFDIEAAEKAAAEQDDDKSTALATDMIRKSTVVLLQDAKIEITKADGDFIDGTLEWSGIGGVNGPRSISGSFHAQIDKD
ncbi:hypothetical protein [Enhygromyxa salina]|uniref:Lipoprotein n=1 Tax=Enhygromyxa salina TaxID=215803 RepID=A0A2S9YPC6_9BACT|nr:hypothetical protein [Enhygromyxa salina]PRQ06943.1 hypothetical protein ENSA7_33670 [Enhygromyxa salina]